LTSDQKHTDHIATGQQLSRHSLPTLLYFSFSPPHIFLNSILASRTNGTFAFAPTAQGNPSAKAKEPFFSQHTDRLTDIKSNFETINFK
jgi:hypothetical protein